MKIYTKTGDTGQTSLANGQRLSKANLQIEAYGTADELNVAVGWLRAINESEQLRWIQNRLFDLGATLAAAPMRLDETDVQQLEQWIDEYQNQLIPLNDFILPSGNEAVCRCHQCRVIARRLERCMVRCEQKSNWITEMVFVNRLSDYFFVFSRFLAIKMGQKEEKWQKK